MPSDRLAELEARIAALEERPITLQDLPLKQLQDKLEQDWQPSADILLQKRSITGDLVREDTLVGSLIQAGSISIDRLAEAFFRYVGSSSAREVVWNFGFRAIPWPGGSIDSTPTVVQHDLGTTPSGVIPWTTSHGYNAATFSYTSTTFTFQCRSVNESTPAAGTSGAFYWLAFALVS